MLVENDKGKLIQRAVSELGGDITIDGIVGYYTIKAVLKVDEDSFAKAIIQLANDHINTKRSIKYGYTPPTIDTMSSKEKIMSYLARYEGTVIHWNRGETNITTPYGIYRKSFPNAKIFKYIDMLSKKYTGKVIRRRNMRQIKILNNSMSKNERKRIYDMAWVFYVNNFMDARITDMLNNKEAMSFFSISVNGGKGRGVKSIHSAVKLKLSSRVSTNLLVTIARQKNMGKDLNNGMLDYMLAFYKTLIKNKPWKFARFKNGWFSRIAGLR